eukprot:Rmarinus@m.20919
MMPIHNTYTYIYIIYIYSMLAASCRHVEALSMSRYANLYVIFTYFCNFPNSSSTACVYIRVVLNGVVSRALSHSSTFIHLLGSMPCAIMMIMTSDGLPIFTYLHSSIHCPRGMYERTKRACVLTYTLLVYLLENI